MVLQVYMKDPPRMTAEEDTKHFLVYETALVHWPYNIFNFTRNYGTLSADLTSHADSPGILLF